MALAYSNWVSEHGTPKGSKQRLPGYEGCIYRERATHDIVAAFNTIIMFIYHIFDTHSMDGKIMEKKHNNRVVVAGENPFHGYRFN